MSRVLFTYSGGETVEQLHWARCLTLACLAAGIEVDSIAPHEFPCTEGEKRFVLRLPGRRRAGFGFWLFITLLLPLQIFVLAFARGYSAIISFESHLSLLSIILLPFRKATRCLFVQKAPWKNVRRSETFFLFRNFLYFRDCFGLMAANKVIVPTKYVADTILSEISLLERFLVILPFSTEGVLSGIEDPADSVSTEQLETKSPREALLDRFDLPEKMLLFATADEMLERHAVEKLIRAMSAADEDRICLFVLGSGPERLAVISIIIGLGLFDRVIFVDDPEEWEKVILGCDLYLLSSAEHGMSRSLMLAFAAEIPVVGVDVPEVHELLGDERLIIPEHSVEEIAQKLHEIVNSQAKYLEIKELSEYQAKKYQLSWTDRVIAQFGAKMSTEGCSEKT